MYAIDKHIPTPELHAAPNRAIYPLREMEVGDSFAVPRERAEALRSVASTAGRNLGRKFTIRKNADGTARCWRIA